MLKGRAELMFGEYKEDLITSFFVLFGFLVNTLLILQVISNYAGNPKYASNEVSGLLIAFYFIIFILIRRLKRSS